MPLTSDFHNYKLADVTNSKGQDTDRDLITSAAALRYIATKVPMKCFHVILSSDGCLHAYCVKVHIYMVAMA